MPYLEAADMEEWCSKWEHASDKEKLRLGEETFALFQRLLVDDRQQKDLLARLTPLEVKILDKVATQEEIEEYQGLKRLLHPSKDVMLALEALKARLNKP